MVSLGGTFSLDSGSSFGGSGGFDLTGVVNNTGSTLTVNGSGLTFGILGGTIDGGTIDLTNGATLVGTNSGGTLSGITLNGTLDMTGPDSVVTVTDGLTLNGSIDLGLAVYTVFNQFASLEFQGAQTLSGAGSIVFGGNPANQINTASSGGDSGTLTIGPGITIHGNSGTIGSNNGGTETPLINQGTIAADVSGGISPFTAPTGPTSAPSWRTMGAVSPSTAPGLTPAPSTHKAGALTSRAATGLTPPPSTHKVGV